LCEYSDFLKRPPETNKYLLTTSEKGTIQLPNFRAHLDLVLCGSANEKQLNMFKRTPDFSSFKGRLALVRVPYLLQYSREAELYKRQIDRHVSGGSVAPHTAQMAALWVVMTRLKRPSPKNHSPELAPLVARLSPLQKAMLYDHGETPLGMKEDDRKLLLRNVNNLREEHEGTEGEFEGIYGSEYEGRRGASPREMMALIASASESQKWHSLSPLSILEEIEDFIKDTSVHDFLRLAVDNGYHDCKQFVSDVKGHYLQLVKREIFDSFSYVEDGEFDRLFSEYFYHVKAHELGESIPAKTTSGFSQNTTDVMSDIEKKLNIKDGIDEFRSSLLSRIGAYATDNPNSELDYSQVFPEIYNTLKQSFWDSRKDEIHESLINILKSFSDERSTLSKSELQAVDNSLQFLKDRCNYDENSARDIVGFIVSQEN
jgi:predicted Ser/Thr protein kinase